MLFIFNIIEENKHAHIHTLYYINYNLYLEKCSFIYWVVLFFKFKIQLVTKKKSVLNTSNLIQHLSDLSRAA